MISINDHSSISKNNTFMYHYIMFLLSVCLCVTDVGMAITNLRAAVGKNHNVPLSFNKNSYF